LGEEEGATLPYHCMFTTFLSYNSGLEWTTPLSRGKGNTDPPCFTPLQSSKQQLSLSCKVCKSGQNLIKLFTPTLSQPHISFKLRNIIKNFSKREEAECFKIGMYLQVVGLDYRKDIRALGLLVDDG
jgi:hypothetical protein